MRLRDGESTCEKGKQLRLMVGQGTSGCEAEVHNSRKAKPKRTRNSAVEAAAQKEAEQGQAVGDRQKKIRFGWGPGKSDLGCPVEKTGYVTMTMFQGTSYCCVVITWILALTAPGM